MNERIKLLIEQATTYIDPISNDGVCWDFDKEKFAQLIVQECSSVVENAVNHREPASTYVGKIKQHFGVEE